MTAGYTAFRETESRRKADLKEKRAQGKLSDRTGPAALQFAYRLLAYRGRSEKELGDRLTLKGFDEHTIAAVLSSLVSQGFLDDRKLAASLKRYAEEIRHLGVQGTRRFLRERGIPREIIEETLADIDETDLARKTIEKKMKTLGQHPQDKTIRRLYGFLYRRGYSAEAIRKALSGLPLKEDLS